MSFDIKAPKNSGANRQGYIAAQAKTHKMTLLRPYFEGIARGEKTVEIRLNDKKRQLVGIGDIIEFTCADSEETISVRVTKKRIFPDFSELTRSYPAASLGFSDSSSKEIADYMTSIYGEDEVKKTCALALEIELISPPHAKP